MTKPRTRAAAGALPAAVAVLAALTAGCGTQHADDGAGAQRPARTAVATPSRPADFPCPGESTTPTPTPTATAAADAGTPPDHYAENHGFRVPIALHGQARCEGLAAAARIEKALEPLRERGDFDPEHTRTALVGLGYPAGKVNAHQNGDRAVGFLIVAPSMCLEGSMYREAAQADAFGGYPDGSDCEPPRGGH
ncbi:hypothetical protein AB0P32_27500 [Streptomyces sp. NPDC085995]|uniref:hypothetical protein n=1 Tax=Streptomyces sp. NPDC085995 TaxID=3154861 RepID=UPI00341D8B81